MRQLATSAVLTIHAAVARMNALVRGRGVGRWGRTHDQSTMSRPRSSGVLTSVFAGHGWATRLQLSARSAWSRSLDSTLSSRMIAILAWLRSSTRPAAGMSDMVFLIASNSSSAVRPRGSRSYVPSALHRSRRLHTVCHGPNRSGGSRQRRPRPEPPGDGLKHLTVIAPLAARRPAERALGLPVRVSRAGEGDADTWDHPARRCTTDTRRERPEPPARAWSGGTVGLTASPHGSSALVAG
jgi:hypothetical protein